MADSNEPLANLIFLKEFSKGNIEIIDKYIDIFIRNTPLLLATLQKQIKQKDFPSVEITAHSLKAQFNFVGFTDGESCARKIKVMAQERKDSSEILTVFNSLNDLCETLYQELQLGNNLNK